MQARASPACGCSLHYSPSYNNALSNLRLRYLHHSNKEENLNRDKKTKWRLMWLYLELSHLRKQSVRNIIFILMKYSLILYPDFYPAYVIIYCISLSKLLIYFGVTNSRHLMQGGRAIIFIFIIVDISQYNYVTTPKPTKTNNTEYIIEREIIIIIQHYIVDSQV